VIARSLLLPMPVAVALLALTVARGQTAFVPSLAAGAYSEEQALRGQEIYYAQCLACHGEDMSGLDQAPPLAGPQFSGVWDGESLWAIVDRIDTMPPSGPGILSRDEAVALLAYMLWYNGLPTGNESLSTRQSVLEDIVFRPPDPASW
jgi:mono/diheme cytochrome c family protein